MLTLLLLCICANALRQYGVENGVNLQIESNAPQIYRIELVVRIDQDGSILRHQPTRSSSFEIGRIGDEIQVFVQNVSTKYGPINRRPFVPFFWFSLTSIKSKLF